MPITLGGSERCRVVERDTGAGAGVGAADGSVTCCCRAVGRDTGAGGVAGSAHGSTAVAGRRGCGMSAAGVFGAAARGDVVCGVDSSVRDGGVGADGTDRAGGLGCAASIPGAAAAGGVAFTRAARAAGLFGSKGGGSVDFLTWSDGESAGATVFAGADVGSPLCA